jgi:hypothetical protein
VSARLRTLAARRALRTLCAALFYAGCPAGASAQVWLGNPIPHAGSIELSGGAIWSGPYDMGARDAEETRNSGTDPFVLFATTSGVTSAVGAQGRVGVYLSHSISVEGGAQYLRPAFETRIASDYEQASDVIASERTTRYVVDGSLVVHLTGVSFADGKGVPFLLGGGGYIREVHERNELIETGREYHGGGGIKLWFGGGPHRLGVRAEAGVSSRTGGFDFGTARRTIRTASASIMYLF